MFRRMGMRRGAAAPDQTMAPPPAAAPAMAPAGPAAAPGTGTRFKMRQRLLAFGDDFYVEDEAGQRVFWIDGKMLRIRDTLFFKTMQGQEVYRIQEKLARIRDTMTIDRAGGGVVARVHKALITPLRDRFEVDIPGGANLKVQGNVLQHEYSLERNRMTVAIVSKRWFRIRDTYGVEVAPGEDALLILAIAVCIDMMTHESR
jgi:uncharacterized protein YxjI